MVDYGSSSFDWTGTQPASNNINVSQTRGNMPYKPASSGPSANSIGLAGAGLDIADKLTTGFNALSTAKFNSKQVRNLGNQEFKTIIGDMETAIGTYQAQQGASGVRGGSQIDVQMAAIGKGAQAAANAKYNARMKAFDIQQQGKRDRDKAIIGAASSAVSAWGSK